MVTWGFKPKKYWQCGLPLQFNGGSWSKTGGKASPLSERRDYNKSTTLTFISSFSKGHTTCYPFIIHTIRRTHNLETLKSTIEQALNLIAKTQKLDHNSALTSQKGSNCRIFISPISSLITILLITILLNSCQENLLESHAAHPLQSVTPLQ